MKKIALCLLLSKLLFSVSLYTFQKIVKSIMDENSTATCTVDKVDFKSLQTLLGNKYVFYSDSRAGVQNGNWPFF